MIFVSDLVPTVWSTEVARWLQRETGGTLLGYVDVAGNVVVAYATHPGPLARHGWLSYEPDQEWDRRIVADTYASSGRRIKYLGEWHSHSLASLRPSREDAQTVRMIAGHEPARLTRPLSAIVVRRIGLGLKWAIYQWNQAENLEAADAAIVSASDLPVWAQ